MVVAIWCGLRPLPQQQYYGCNCVCGSQFTTLVGSETIWISIYKYILCILILTNVGLRSHNNCKILECIKILNNEPKIIKSIMLIIIFQSSKHNKIPLIVIVLKSLIKLNNPWPPNSKMQISCIVVTYLNLIWISK